MLDPLAEGKHMSLPLQLFVSWFWMRFGFSMSDTWKLIQIVRGGGGGRNNLHH